MLRKKIYSLRDNSSEIINFIKMMKSKQNFLPTKIIKFKIKVVNS